jgi:predicted metal-dependent peptidase
MADRMKELVAKFVLRNHYWGYLFSRIRRQAVLQGLRSIMGIGPVADGTLCLYYDPNLLENTKDDIVLKLLEHEGMHILNKHVSRFLRMRANEVSTEKITERKKHAWNIACDCCVNEQCSFPKTFLIAGQEWPLCFPLDYKLPLKKATEYYYHELLKQNKNQGGSDSGTNENRKAVCSHDKWDAITNEVSDLSSLSRKLDHHTMKIIRESIKNFNQQRGRLPAGIEELIQQALKPPEAPYYQIIRKYVRASRLSKFQRSSTRINRKRTYVFALDATNKNIPIISPFPGKKRNFSFFVCILLDTSGSMSKDDILEGLSGIKSIIENDKNCKVMVIECDAQVQKEYEVKKIRDIQFGIKGRGGTELYPGLKRAKLLQCDVVLGFTDGYCDNINGYSRKSLPKKIIWVVSQRGVITTINKTGPVVRIN